MFKERALEPESEILLHDEHLITGLRYKTVVHSVCTQFCICGQGLYFSDLSLF